MSLMHCSCWMCLQSWKSHLALLVIFLFLCSLFVEKLPICPVIFLHILHFAAWIPVALLLYSSAPPFPVLWKLNIETWSCQVGIFWQEHYSLQIMAYSAYLMDSSSVMLATIHGIIRPIISLMFKNVGFYFYRSLFPKNQNTSVENASC